MVMIIRHIAGRSVPDVARRVGICVPYRRALAILLPRTLDLVGRGCRPPVETLGELPGGAGRPGGDSRCSAGLVRVHGRVPSFFRRHCEPVPFDGTQRNRRTFANSPFAATIWIENGLPSRLARKSYVVPSQASALIFLNPYSATTACASSQLIDC